MLAIKKIPIKKLIIYISIIFFMICGSAFMLYKNNQLTAYRVVSVNDPVVFNNFAPVTTTATTTASSSSLEVEKINNQTITEPSQTLNKNNINQNSDFDLNIFSSDKFKNLQETVFIIKEQPEVGKRDPFKPN
jgi:hypothetical protein